ncbi:MAG: PDZ domain-containing protein [Deltaproteobacteria bacterium]|nr:PDZ domain-containing protein [Deltaproteobacteria bacterium]
MSRTWPGAALALTIGILLAAPGAARAQADQTLMRFPTMHGDRIVFVAHGNLWEVARTGGTARRLTADPGDDLLPRFSPDGKWIAFTASYQGNQDVYVIPAGGGVAQRLTFHSDVVDHAPTRWGPDNMVVTWTPDSKNIVFLSRRMAWNTWFGRLYAVPIAGGLPTPLPIDRGGLLSYSPDGGTIVYNRIFRNFRTWKRYDGGLAQDLYTYTFATKQLTRITDWKGTDTAPMWSGDTIYFLSDRDDKRRANLWAYDTRSKQTTQLTTFTDYDIDWPSLSTGPGTPGIVFQQGGHLWVLDLPKGKATQLSVSVPDDGTRTSPRYVDAGKAIRDSDTAGQTNYALAPNGKRALFSARGDLFTVPAEHGGTRNLTETSGADEDHPTWSPDGKTLAYTTDRTGEQQLALRPATGGAEKVLTSFKTGFLYAPRWSPDARHLAISDGNHRLWLVDAATGRTTQIASDKYAEIHDQSWSPDGAWIALSIVGENQQRGIWLYSVAQGKASLVSPSTGNDFAPVFSPDGKYLYFASTRHENPTFSETETDTASLKTSGIYVATLRAADPSPLAPRSDEGAYEAKPRDEKPAPWKPGAIPAMKIDLAGLMNRAVPVPTAPASLAALDARADKIFYLTVPPQMITGPLPGETAELHVYDLSERKDAVVAENVASFSLSADGQKVMYLKQAPHQDGEDSEGGGGGGGYVIADAKAAQPGDKGGAKPVDVSGMRARIVPSEEWAEMFANAWRLERDLFFNPKMNGVDWPAVRRAYAKLLPLAGSREDLNYLIGEMQGELGNSHTYVGGGDRADPTPSVPTALLGVDFALDAAAGRYRLATIYPGDNTRPAYRSPLTEPGVDVRAGDYLLAVNGHELRAPADPYSLFVGLGDGPVTLTVAATATGARRTAIVRPIENELALREKAWIDHNRALVDKASGGKIGYIYLSDMGALGMEQFVRQFYPQLDKQALILDDRWNGGGFIDQILLSRLRRELVGMDTNREGGSGSNPAQLIAGPKVCLINEYSASDGDIFPHYFRAYGLGPLIGKRTWGGIRGIRGGWGLLDGGYITVPEFSLYGLKSEWVIENHGVEPDMEVDTDPGKLLAGQDDQLQAGIDYLMKELAKHPGGKPPPPPPTPAYPPAGQVPPPSL